jgi:hypothetical protein
VLVDWQGLFTFPASSPQILQLTIAQFLKCIQVRSIQTDPPSSITKQVSNLCNKSKKPDFKNPVIGMASVDKVFFANDDVGCAAITDDGCGAPTEAFLPLWFI